MNNTYTISQVSELIDLSAKTIRFYEEKAVFSIPLRAENNYRIYTNEMVEQLKLIKSARDLGLPLREIKKLMRGCLGSHCQHSKHFIIGRTNNYLRLLSLRADEFNLLHQRVKQLKKKLLTEKGSGQNNYRCSLLSQLILTAKIKVVPLLSSRS